MRHVLTVCLAAMLAAAAMPAAAKDAPSPVLLAEKDRASESPRAVLVDLRQSEIATEVDIGRVAPAAAGGGLIGALIIEGQDDRAERLTSGAQQRAEAAVAPLRRELEGFDIGKLALGTTAAALARVDWFNPGELTLNTGDPETTQESFLQSAGPQFATVVYSYGISPDFTQIRVIADIRLRRKTKSRSKRDADESETEFFQRIVSIAELRERSYEHYRNVERWSANDAGLARESLAQAFARLERLIPFALDLDQAELRALEAKNAPKAFAAGNYGAAVTTAGTAPGETLIWKDGLINVLPAP